MKQYLLAVMEKNQRTELKGNYFKFTSKLNQPAVEITDELGVPFEFLVQPEPPPPKPDKLKIRDELKKGTKFAWAKLIQKKRLVIS